MKISFPQIAVLFTSFAVANAQLRGEQAHAQKIHRKLQVEMEKKVVDGNGGKMMMEKNKTLRKRKKNRMKKGVGEVIANALSQQADSTGDNVGRIKKKKFRGVMSMRKRRENMKNMEEEEKDLAANRF
mmetsp:Transcript_9317/g.22881  ORF Transcript_9317/g.22881 Transcript_9317/m.22881 type:complete len:128 (-) Transcript_9317:208-591(-)|eukprot:CAMPEP_0197179600 /NCGR_PEP_ID=MMETSP1423-20130617/4491_1 /TAXON_ID=476441 /ORGANISM="Pseudo-nitzschia heimii, Strain UNC1101" /LENGTH=127 /DNA_ID=CAMNT_0042629525 /DNA_START=90 /DNA_END=473 /DNA_ORIENTATION=-